MTLAIGYDDVVRARRRIEDRVHETPVIEYPALARELGADVVLKCENFQKGGAFKLRGASNAVASLSDEKAARGVATHSSGNHGAALALAAARRGIPAYVVMPENSNPVKIRNVRHYGADVIFCEPTQAAREAGLAHILSETGSTEVPPYDHPAVMAGQGTAALELLEAEPALDVVVVPVGGGGLISGVATVVRHRLPAARIHGVEPAGADDTIRSLAAGRVTPVRPDTIADGLRATVGNLTFEVIRERVDSVVAVTDSEIEAAMEAVYRDLDMLIEPSAATGVAALREGRLDVRGARVGVIVTGGNVDPESIPWREEGKP